MCGVFSTGFYAERSTRSFRESLCRFIDEKSDIGLKKRKTPGLA